MSKRKKISLIAGMILVIAIGVCIWKREEIQEAYWRYAVYKSTKSLPRCDRVEVYHLNPIMEDAGATGFPIEPYDKFAEIVEHKTLKGTEAEDLAELWRSQKFAEKSGQYQALCHYPAFGFRFYRGSSLVFQTSLCFECSNFYVTTLGKSAFWGINDVTPQGTKLLERLLEIFPESVTPKEKEILKILKEEFPEAVEVN